MSKRKAFSILADYERCTLGDMKDSPPELVEAIMDLTTPEQRLRFIKTRIGCLRQWLKFAPTVPKGNEDLFERLFRHADKYETAREFVGAIHAGKCFEVGACIKDCGTGMTGFIVREGTVTTKKWPCWVVDSGGGREELMVKDCVSYRDITGCHDTVLVCVWNFANNWKRLMKGKKVKYVKG
jgi:hypothetical protein